MINSWEDFVNLLINNSKKLNFGIRRFWLNKEKNYFENYIEVTSNIGVTLFINDDEKTVSLIEKYGDKIIELEIAFNCTYDRYIKLINAIFNIDLMEKNDVTC